MTRYGHISENEEDAQDLRSEFEEAAEQNTVQVLGENMRKTRESTEREHALTRLISTVPRLAAASDLGLVMEFLYRIQCDANGDTTLALKAAVAQCGVLRFAGILRSAPATKKGWEQACTDVLTSIDQHFMQAAKDALNKEMSQQPAEDPTQYADRVLTKMDVFVYFAAIKNKTVDNQEIARAWVKGLSSATKMSVSVALNMASSYTIQEALAIARIAHDASMTPAGLPQDSMSSHLQSMAHQQFQPAVPPIDGAFLQQVVEGALAKCTAPWEARLAAIEPARYNNRDARITQNAERPAGLPTRFPCVFPTCRKALHRWDDCPYKQQCRHCTKPGHHSDGCYDEYPELSHFAKRSPNKARRDRDRSPARPRERDQSQDRARDRDRDRDRDKNRDNRSPSKARGDSSGKRLNEKGRG
jgi:hypothetical protein